MDVDVGRTKTRAHHVTAALIVASVVLIGASLVGRAGGLGLAGGLVAASGLLWWARDHLAEAPTVVGYDLGWYGARLWTGVLVAAALAGVARGLSPGELQAVGGGVGLLGATNHVLRPLYLYGLGLAGRLRS